MTPFVRRHLVALAVVLVVVVAGAGAAVAHQPPRLTATGPTRVAGTDASAVFRIGDRTIRQVRYRDHGTLVYTFTLRNDGPLPLTVTGLAPQAREPRLFHYLGVATPDGRSRFGLDPGSSQVVQVRLRMQHCETLSARAGSFADVVPLRTVRAGMLHDTVVVTFPEEVHTSSPREAFCPNSTATSRPPG
ncbi:MAG: hypothetical protein ACXVWU_05955 [Nocardioides sp.]